MDQLQKNLPFNTMCCNLSLTEKIEQKIVKIQIHIALFNQGIIKIFEKIRVMSYVNLGLRYIGKCLNK